MKNNILLLIFMAALVISGCASTQVATHAQLMPLNEGSPIHVVIEIEGVLPPDALDAIEATGAGVKSGAIGGAGLGMYASQGCGPFFFICLPVTTIIGAVGGTIIGGGVGAAIALPEDKAIVLEQIVKEYLGKESISENVLTEFERQQKGRWIMVEEDARVKVTLGIESLIFDQFSGEKLLIRLTSNMVVSYGPGAADKTKRILLKAESEKHHVDYWMAANGTTLKAELTALFQENSRQIIGILNQGFNTGR